MTEEIKTRIESIRKGEVPNGYSEGVAGILPNDWTSKPLSEISEVIAEQAGDDDYETLSISAGIGFVNQAQKFGKELSGKQYEKYTVIRKGDFAYNKGNSKRYPQGCTYRLKERDEAAVPNVFECFRIAEGCPEYYEQLFINGFMNRQLMRKINHGVRDDGLLNLTDADFYSTILPVPPLAEQQKIAKILSSCDAAIQKYKSQKSYFLQLKKYLLSKMFPDINSEFPELRFEEFTTPWEIHKFGEMFKRRMERNNGQFDKTRWISVAQMYFQEPDKVTSNNIDTRTYVMRKGDIAFEGHQNQDYKYGRFVENDIGDGVISELFPIYEHMGEFDLNYWKYAIQIEEIMAPKLLRCIEISYTSSNKLDEKFFLNEKVAVPSILEQERIGNLFKEIDTLINLYTQMLDELRRQKDFLSTVLLTGVVRV